MKTSQISGILFCVALFFTPLLSQAYFTTSQTALKVSNTAALFMIEYAFGFDDKDVYLPVVAQRGLMHEDDANMVGYTFRSDEKVVESGTAVGLVLSAAPIVDGMYMLEKGKAQSLTLFVVLSTDAHSPEQDFSLQVEKLPYHVTNARGNKDEYGLNPTELQYYVTKEIELNSPSE